MTNKIFRIAGKFTLWLIVFIIGLVLLLALAIQLPSVQQKLINGVTSYVSNKTHTRVAIGKIRIGFPKNIVLQNVFAEDLKHDTLLSVGELSVGIDMLALAGGNVFISRAELTNLTANIYRTLPDSSFNFGFFIDAFSSAQTPVKTEEPSDSTSINLEVKNILLSNIKLVYKDEVSGLSAKGHIGKLDLEMKDIDLARMEFMANQLVLSESDIEINIEKPSPKTIDTNASSPLPNFSINKINVNKIHFVCNNKPDSFLLNTQIGLLQIEPQLIDLNAQHIVLHKFLLHQSGIDIATIAKAIKNDTTNTPTSANWNIAVNTVDLKENGFKYDVHNIAKQPSGIDYNHLHVRNLNLQASALSYSGKAIKGNIKQLTLTEQCGLNLLNLHTQFIYDGTHAELANLLVKTPQTHIANYASVTYNGIDNFSKNIGTVNVNFNFKQTQIAMQDVLLFAPGIQLQEIIKQNKNQFIKLNGKIKGKVNNLNFENIVIETAQKTAIAFNGNISGLPDANQLAYNINVESLFTTQTDLAALLPKNLLPSSINIPQQVNISGTISGNIQSNQSNIKIHSSSGYASVATNLHQLNSVPLYSANIKTNKFDIGHIIKQPLIGTVTGSIEAGGKSFNADSMQANLLAQISTFEFNNYNYSNINLTAKADSGKYITQLNINDAALQFTLNADASLRNKELAASINLVLAGADLKQLKLTTQSIKTNGVLTAQFQQKDSNNITGNVSIANVNVVKNNQKYKLDSFAAVSVNTKRNASLLVNNSLIKVSYKGETGLTELSGVVQNYLAQLIGTSPISTDTLSQSFVCSVQLNPHPFLNEVLMPELKQFGGLTANAAYNSKQQSLNVKVDAPLIEYQNQILKGIAVNIVGNDEKLNYNISLQEFVSGSVSIPTTTLRGNIEQQIITYQLKIINPDSGYKLVLAGNMNMHDKNKTIIHFEDSAVFNNTLWRNAKQNAIAISRQGINVQQFELLHDKEFIKISSQSMHDNAPIDITFNQFELGTLSKIIEKDKAIVRGLLQGNITIQSTQNFAFTSDLTVSGIAFNNVGIGNLSIKANNLTSNKYEAWVSLVGEQNNVTLSGNFYNNKIDFGLTIGKLNLKTVETFIPKIITQSDGYISGNMHITGNINQPQFNGEVVFNNTALRLTAINTPLKMHREKISVNNKGIYFEHFTVSDSLNQPLVINGNVLTSDFKSMAFAVDITTKNFRLMHTTAAQNDVYYGTILLSSTIKIRGTDKLPIIKADAHLLEGSSFTVIVQEKELNTDKGNGVVVFKDSSQMSLMQTDTQRVEAALTGLDFNANIEVNKLTRFNIITDKISGDNLVVGGDAVLNFGIDPSGKMTLSGVYTLNDGSYKASFQKIVKRNFTIKKGSTITWNGDPLDANLNLTATYSTRTPAVDLLANELQGMSETQRAEYRKLLNYDVNLMIQGEILKPQLAFSLDMPLQKERAALRGEPYAKINDINNDPNELNRQVFALLVLERFLPTGQSSATTGDAVSGIARNSVNAILSDQLNRLSGKFVKGAELNFNLQSNDEYSGAQTKQSTELQIGLKKELFNNRMSVEVGSNIELGNAAQQTSQQNISGDVVAEYKITDDGSYRFKAFMENQYEGVIDGTLYKQGVGIIYTRDYNHINELFKPTKTLQDTSKK